MKLRTLTEACEALGVTRRRLRDGIRSGRYPCLTWGNRSLVDLDALEAIVREEERARSHEGLAPLKECAEAIGVSVDTLRRMARANAVPHEWHDGQYFFDIANVIEHLRTEMQRESERET